MKIPKEFEDVFRGVDLTEGEIRTLTWIAGWESRTVKNLRSAIQKAQDAALSALRPVSREQVEQVWSGCPYCKEDGEGYVQKFGAYSIQNGELTTGHCKPQKIKFCPHCSRPLTDEAVDMVMERLEALHEHNA